MKSFFIYFPHLRCKVPLWIKSHGRGFLVTFFCNIYSAAFSDNLEDYLIIFHVFYWNLPLLHMINFFSAYNPVGKMFKNKSSRWFCSKLFCKLFKWKLLENYESIKALNEPENFLVSFFNGAHKSVKALHFKF